MYKEASKQKLRVQSNKGPLSVEQLWELSLSELDEIAVNLEEEYKKSGKKSYLVAKSKKDKTLKLKFDIVLDILTSKVESEEKAKIAGETKRKLDRVIAIRAKVIESKEEEDIAEMSDKEFDKYLKTL